MSTKNCPTCGVSVPENAAFCPNCGANLSSFQQQTPPTYQSQAPPQPPTPPQPPQRPTGVVVLAVLEVIGGLYSILAGAAAGTILGAIAPFLAAFGALFIVIGIINLVLAWGLYNGKSWARIVAMVFAVISLISIPIGTIIGIIILYYLTRPHVKAFFGAT
jgi:hypothetical protein